MKPLRLQLTAFGPYARQVTIDFRRLAAGGLFLIHGPTGAGKTSILDGLCFALYGSSSGSERKGEGMRCQLSPPDLATEAQLEFLLGSQLFRIVRRPEQALNKKRGAGTMVGKPFGELLIWDGTGPDRGAAAGWDAVDLDTEAGLWKPLATGANKVFEKIVTLLGMNDEQFRQVVVLPQGQFRKFLSSNSSDRERILETLFRTQRYREAIERLNLDSKALEESFKGRRQMLDGQLQSLEVPSIAEFENQRTQLEKNQIDLQNGHQNLENHHRRLQKDLRRIKEIQRLRDEWTRIRESRDALTARVPEIRAHQLRLELDEFTVGIFEIEARREAAELETENLLQQIKIQDTTLAETARTVSELRAQARALLERQPEMDQADRERTQLLEQLHRAEQLDQLNQQLTQLTTQRIQVEGVSRVLSSKLEELKRQTAFDQQAIERQLALALKLPELTAEQKLLDLKSASLLEAEKLLSSIERFEAERSKIEAQNASAEVELAKCRRSQLERQRDFHHSMAGRLALELDPLAPCPVCGSPEHPRPARLPPRAPSQAELDAGQEEVQRQELILQTSSQRLVRAASEIELRVDELNRRLAPVADRDLKTLHRRYQELRSELDRKLALQLETIQLSRDADKFATQMRIKIEESARLIPSLEREQRDSERTLDEIGAQFSTLDLQRAELELRLPEDRRDPNAIVQAGRAIREKLERFKTETEQVRQDLERSIAKLTGIQSRIEILKSEAARKGADAATQLRLRDQALNDSPFANFSACRDARLAEAKRRELIELVRQHQERMAVVSVQLSDVEQRLKDTSFNSPSNIDQNIERSVEQLEAEFAIAEQARSERLNQAGALAAQLDSLNKAKTKLLELESEMRSLSDRYALIGRLSGVASGRPPHNLSGVNFSRYVLSAQLDEVLEQASRRLMLMSQGQFLLRRVRNREDRRLTAGLDLEVEDSFTGTARSAAYLSGGESFLASLALALGLADVVQSHLGGVRLDAVFVDEGFGSLDSDALERAMRTLGDLPTGGRLVGIISHVPELKEQIRDRLYVRKSPEGSHVAWES